MTAITIPKVRIFPFFILYAEIIHINNYSVRKKFVTITKMDTSLWDVLQGELNSAILLKLLADLEKAKLQYLIIRIDFLSKILQRLC